MSARFDYCVVTHNGHGVHSTHGRLADAKRAAEARGEKAPEFGPYEIERVEHHPGRSRSYWMRKRSRWVPWRVDEDIDARAPDWRWPSA